MSKRQYRIFLEKDGEIFPVNPVFEDITKDETKEGERAFGRDSINEPLTFQRADYDLIFESSINQEFIVHIDLKINFDDWQIDWFKGKFTRPDLDLRRDDRTIVVDVDPLDRYTNVIEGMDKEFNLIELAPEISTLEFSEQGILQVYIAGSTILMNFLSGTYWETPVEPIFTGIQTEPFGFGDFSYLYFIPGSGSLDPDVSGYYLHDELGGPYDREDGHYRIDFIGGQYKIVDLFDSSTVVYTMPIGYLLTVPNPFDIDNIGVFSSETSGSECRLFRLAVVARLLTTKTEVLGIPTIEVPIIGYVPDPGVHPEFVPAEGIRSLPLGALTNYIISDLNNVEPDQYGKFSASAVNFAGRYFVKPVDPDHSIIYPVNRFEWTNVSIWFYYDAGIQSLIEAASETIVYRHTYKFPDIIAAFLKVIAPGVTHEENINHSIFLYGSSNSIRGGRKYPIFAPKSNILEGEYDKPAEVANCRFADFLKFAEDFWQLLWYIDDENRFIFEHVEYFRNGRSYVGENIGTDFTETYEPSTGLHWDFDSDKWKYRKISMPEQIKFEWMDKSSFPFNGYPIEHLDKYVEKGSIDTRNLSLFTSDIDFMLSNRDEIARDGFFFCEAIIKGPSYVVPFIEFLGYNMQNGWASLLYAHNRYWKYNLSCTNVKINNEETTALSTKRTRYRDLEYAHSEEPNILDLIETRIGVGLPSKKVVSLISGAIQLTVNYEHES